MPPEIILWLGLATVVVAGIVSTAGSLRRTAERRHEPYADGGPIYGGGHHHHHDKSRYDDDSDDGDGDGDGGGDGGGD